jgi:hypothetical protein
MDSTYDYLVITTQVGDDPADHKIIPPPGVHEPDGLKGALERYIRAGAPDDLPTGVELVIRVRPVRLGVGG